MQASCLSLEDRIGLQDDLPVTLAIWKNPDFVDQPLDGEFVRQRQACADTKPSCP